MNLYIFIILFIYIYSISIIRLPFNRTIPTSIKITPENYKNYIYESNYYTIINVGSNNQLIPMRLSFNSYQSFLTISNYSGDFIKYDPDKSTTYQKTYGERYFSFINILKGMNSKEKFTLKDIDNKEISCNNINFILATVPNVNISGEFGMCPSTKDEQYNQLFDYNFILNLYNNNYIKHKIFSINFFNKNSGEILIGDRPSEYSNYDKDTFVEKNIPIDKNGYFWGLLELRTSLNGKTLYIKDQTAKFAIESYVIKPHVNYKDRIDELFFNEKIKSNKCIFVNESIEYSFYHCDKDIDLTNFPTLSLYQRTFNYTFELNASDLFEDFEDRKYFLMNFVEEDDDISSIWILGQPFLKKYKFTYNFDARTVGMYFGMIEEEKQENEEKENKENEFNKFWIILIICSVIIITLGIIIYILIRKIPRKKRANELEENFDYNGNINTNDNNNVNNNENGLGINN